MRSKRRHLYSSANGDAWYLERSLQGDLAVVHEPNAPSGGETSHVPIATFLARGPLGPEHQELLRLIGTLVDADVHDPTVKTA